MLSGDPTAPVLSIVIPSHRRADLLRLCLDSVTRHAPPATEVIVVDDGSTECVISATASAFAGVRVVRLPRARGFCVAANSGIRAARAPVIELLNDDTRVTAGWAEAALGRFDDPRVGAVAPLVLQGPDSGNPIRIDSAGDECDPGGVYRKRGHGQPLSPDYLQARDVFGASGSSAFYRRSAMDRVGLFPEEFGAYFEDVDLAFRLNRAGYRVVYEPACRVWHRVGASYRRKDRRLIERQSCNEERVFWRNLSGRDAVRYVPRHLAVLAGKALLRCREGTLIPFLAGRLRLFGELPQLLRHRRVLRNREPAA